MRILNRKAAAWVASHPVAFLLQCIKGFRANQGLLLAGAVAYYSLLSIVPLLMLVAVVLSHWFSDAVLLQTIGRYLEWLIPGQSRAIVHEVSLFLHLVESSLPQGYSASTRTWRAPPSASLTSMTT